MPNKLPISDEAMIARKRNQNKEAAQKFRDANKQQINERRRELYLLKKQGKASTQTTPAPVIVPPVQQIFDEPENEVHETLNFDDDFYMPPSPPAPKAKKLNKKIVLQQDVQPVRQSSRLKKKLIIEEDSEDEYFEIPKKKVTKKKRPKFILVNDDGTEELLIAPPKTNKTNKVTHLSQKEVNEFLPTLVNEKRSESSIKTHIADMDRFYKATHCDNAVKCFNEYDDTLFKFDNYIQTSGSSKGLKFSLNTKKGLYNTICLILDNYKNLDVSTANNEKWHSLAKAFNYKSHKQTEDNKDMEVPHLLDYTDNLNKTFGENSKLFIIFELFLELNGTRDDFDLVLVDNEDDTGNEEHNYLVLTKKGDAKIIINNFKTQRGYAKKNKTISKYLTDKIRKYIADNKIAYNKFIFGKSQSDLISKANKKMGYNQDVDAEGRRISNGSINMWRKMLRTFQHEQNPNMSDEELVKLAEDMQHSAVTHNQYLRKTQKK